MESTSWSSNLSLPMYGAQLYLVKAVHLEEKSSFYIIVQTSHSKVGVIHKSVDISRIAILPHKMLLGYVMDLVVQCLVIVKPIHFQPPPCQSYHCKTLRKSQYQIEAF